MSADQYVVHVSVDGVPIPDSQICWGYAKHPRCSLYASSIIYLHQKVTILLYYYTLCV